MKDMSRVARTGLEALARAPVPLLVGGIAWTLANALLTRPFGPLLIGPALFGLSVVALKAMRGHSVTWKDNFAALREPTTPLVAGILLMAPFSVWSLIGEFGHSLEVSQFHRDKGAVPGVPLVVSLALVVFFSVYVYVFPILADAAIRSADAAASWTTPPDPAAEQPLPLAEAVQRAHALAELPARPGSRWSPLGRQILYTSSVLVVAWLAALAVRWKPTQLSGVPYVIGILAGPAAVGLICAWHEHRRGEPAGAAQPARDAEDDADPDEYEE